MNYFDFLQDLILTPSVTGNEKAVAEMLHAFLARHFPYDVLQLQEVSTERYNVILVKGHPVVTLTTHMDVVPGQVDVMETHERITGRGACDAKGQIVTQLWALQDAIGMGLQDYACFYVVGEEVDSCGAMSVMTQPTIGSTYLINGEPTGNRFVKRSRGVLECTLRARGEAKHSSLSEHYSAIHQVIRDSHALIDNVHAHTQVNIGVISGGLAPNVTASEASAALCVRSDLASVETLNYLRKNIQHSELVLTSCAIEPFSLFVPEHYVDDAITVNFCSDAAIYAARFRNIMLFGPGHIEFAHDKHEHILKSEMIAGKNIIQQLLISLRD